MRPWKSRRKRTAYSRLVAQVAEHDVIRDAEEVVGAAWMARLRDAEAQAVPVRRALGRVRDSDRHEGLRQFAERERAAWVEAERMRALEVLADQDRLAEAAHRAGKKKGRAHERR
jgi:hypothetical protein